MRYKTVLLFGAPGSGKGTQGKILGAIPGFYHSACGDVFRTLDLQSEMGRTFWQFSSELNCKPNQTCPYRVPGTREDMDVNVFRGSETDLKQLFQ